MGGAASGGRRLQQRRGGRDRRLLVVGAEKMAPDNATTQIVHDSYSAVVGWSMRVMSRVPMRTFRTIIRFVITGIVRFDVGCACGIGMGGFEMMRVERGVWDRGGRNAVSEDCQSSQHCTAYQVHHVTWAHMLG
jgi:hypothetical protein